MENKVTNVSRKEKRDEEIQYRPTQPYYWDSSYATIATIDIEPPKKPPGCMKGTIAPKNKVYSKSRGLRTLRLSLHIDPQRHLMPEFKSLCFSRRVFLEPDFQGSRPPSYLLKGHDGADQLRRSDGRE